MLKNSRNSIYIMRLNIFKNTVLFPIAIGIVLIISCANAKGENDKNRNHKSSEEQRTEV